MQLIFISIAAFIFTFLGGAFALRFKDKLHLILGFSAGAVIGVAFFDLIPEAIELGGISHEISTITAIVALGFIFYMILDRFIIMHGHSHHDHVESEKNCAHNNRGLLGAGSLSIHSFLDGVAVGLAFQVSSAVGIIVAVAVLVHDFSDGINTVNMILKNGGNRKKALKWLFVDSIAPVLGVVSTLFFELPESTLGLVLAVFAGFFLYIGASDLLPESHHSHPTKWTTIMTVLGLVVMFLAIRIAGL
ncbi:MAG: ZIP family metal transporter [Candidatus Paceibacterota bacterium]